MPREYVLLREEGEGGEGRRQGDEEHVAVGGEGEEGREHEGSRSVLSKTQKWLLAGVLLVGAAVAVTVPLVVREHQYEDGTSVAVVTHEVDASGASAVSYNSHLATATIRNFLDLEELAEALDDGAGDEQQHSANASASASAQGHRRRRDLVCKNEWPRNTVLELASLAQKVYDWTSFQGGPEDVETNHLDTFQVRALVFAMGTFQHGWFRDSVRVDPSSARVLSYMGSTLRASDWVENFRMFCQQTPASYTDQAEAVASRAQSALPQGARIVLYTGHSLGGALAGLQAGAGRGCAVGFNSPPLSALTRRTDDMVTYRIDTDIVSLPYDPDSRIWQRVSSIASRLDIRCNDQEHLGPVHTMPLPRSFSFGRLMRDAFTAGAGAVLTPFSPSAPEWAQFIRDALASHGIDTVKNAIQANTQATEESWWCRNVGFGC